MWKEVLKIFSISERKETARQRWLLHIACDMLWNWYLVYQEKFKWATLWKRAAKKWRKRAFLLASDNNSQRAIASQVPYLKERIKDLERQIPARTFDIEDYLYD